MWKRVLLGTGAVLAMGVAGFLTFAPAYVERGMNPVTNAGRSWPVDGRGAGPAVTGW